MTHKKWLLAFIITFTLTSCFVGLFNVLVDPFGVFGDPIISWDSYNMTNNPRTAKITYLDEVYEKYDGYVIGCSKTSSIKPETLNKYENASYYNLMMYGGDLYDIERTAQYVIDNYHPEHIIVNLGIEEAVSYNVTYDKVKSVLHGKVDDGSLILFYLKNIFMNPVYSFEKLMALDENTYLPTQYDVFIPETGSYDKRVRDIEAISDLETYLSDNPAFTYDYGSSELNVMTEALNAVASIKEACEDSDTRFTLILSPVTNRELNLFPEDSLRDYWNKLADITDYWDFSGYNAVSGDNRYFYDNYHFRNSVGDMMLAKIYENQSDYIPEDFGHYISKDNVENYMDSKFDNTKDYTTYSRSVPILMYHHLIEDNSAEGTVVSIEKFENDMAVLQAKGYTTIHYQALIDYVEKGIELPEKPIIISLDDGYESNYNYVYPVLDALDMKATISIIGMSMGADVYKDSNHQIIPHFTVEQAKEMLVSGHVDIQSHSFALHDVPSLEDDSYRENALMLSNETIESYRQAMLNDYNKMSHLINSDLKGNMSVFTYPIGAYDTLSEVVLREMGFKVTVTVDHGVNEVIKGLPQSLLALKRINITESVDLEQLLNDLEK